MDIEKKPKKKGEKKQKQNKLDKYRCKINKLFSEKLKKIVKKNKKIC
jgi:hypothetical protein